MQSGHLSSFKSSCLLFVILACCLSMAWAGVILRRTPHIEQKLQERNLDTVASKSPSNSKSSTDAQTRDSRFLSRSVIITPSQHRELLETGETTIRLSPQGDINQQIDSKKAFHRIARRRTSLHRQCYVEELEIVYRLGSCIRLNSNVTGCQTERVTDLFHPSCIDM